ncbi:hypothetical protein [Oleidesulfovibrio sp.]|uniref:hypothetical protein n=1 Tax=Oleidesulfovibrio sp. TaxID=2909707 RepID=UPI003A8455AD
MQHRRLFFIKATMAALLLATILLLSGCGSIQSKSDNSPVGFDFDMASAGTLYLDAWVHRREAQVLVHPTMAPMTPPKAIFVPFRMNQDMREGSEVAEQISRMFWQSWLKQQTFESLQYSPQLMPFTPARSIAAGRALGADLVVSGYVTRLLAGGTTGDSRLAVQLDIYDTVTGEMVWSMVHAGFIEQTTKRDYLLFTQDARLPAEPVWALATVLAADMALPIKRWQHEADQNEEDPFAPAPAPQAQDLYVSGQDESASATNNETTPATKKKNGTDLLSTVQGWFN